MEGGDICYFCKEIKASAPQGWQEVGQERGKGDKRQPQNVWGVRCVYLVKKSGHPSPQVRVWENWCTVSSKRGTGRGGKGANHKRQPQNVCRVGGVRRCVYLLMKSGQPPPPIPSWGLAK